VVVFAFLISYGSRFMNRLLSQSNMIPIIDFRAAANLIYSPQTAPCQKLHAFH